MNKDPKSSIPAKGDSQPSLEDLVYRSSLSAGNKDVQRADRVRTVTITLVTYVVFGLVVMQLVKHSQVVQKAVQKTVGIDLTEQKENDAPPPATPPPPTPPQAPAAPVAPPRPVKEDVPPPPVLPQQETVPELPPKELPKVDNSLTGTSPSPSPASADSSAGTSGTSTGTAGVGSSHTLQTVHVEASPLRVRYQPPLPPYPLLAKISRIQGTVVVEILVGMDGLPVSAKVVSGPSQLRDTAVTYAMQWRFEPDTRGEDSVQRLFILNIPFKLH